MLILEGRPSIAIASIGWKNDDDPRLGANYSIETVLDEMQEADYAGAELGGSAPTDLNILLPLLKSRNLQLVNAWHSTNLTDFSERGLDAATNTLNEVEKFKEKVVYLYDAGSKRIGPSEQGGSIQGKNVPIFGDLRPVHSDYQWDVMADGLDQMAEVAEGHGLTLVYHHHLGTGIQTRKEVDRLMRGTKKVKLLYDTGHLVAAGEDHLGVLDDHIDRIAHVHLKDVREEVLAYAIANNLSFMDAVRAGMFTVPGDGMIDFIPVFERLKKYSDWIVIEAEQDPAKANPLIYARKGREYIREHAGV